MRRRNFLWLVMALLLSISMFTITCNTDDDDDDDNDDDYDDYNENEFRTSYCMSITWAAFQCDHSFNADHFYGICVETPRFNCVLYCYDEYLEDYCDGYITCLLDCAY